MLHRDESLEPAPIKKGTSTQQRIGIKDGKKLYADGYDFDEMNEQIADWLGGDQYVLHTE
jgi:hypothetical protein